MATYLYHVKILQAAGVRVVMELRIITGEQPDFDTGRAFGLMLLYDPITRAGLSDAPLARVVSLANITDLNWLDEHLENYVDDAVLTKKTNHPVQADLAKMRPTERNAFFASNKAPLARFAVTVTKPEWIAHLRPAMQWDTTAYDPYC